MLLDESDIDAIVEHLGNEVQFYDSRGVADNNLARNKIRDALRSYVASPSSKAAERFRLIEIAFQACLDAGGGTAGIAVHTVELADAVLAAMEPEPSKPPGPSSLAAVRAELHKLHGEGVDNSAAHPTKDPEVAGYRNGHIFGLSTALKVIDAAMEPEAPRPTCRATLEFVRCAVQSHLDSRLSYYECNPASGDERVLGHRNGVRHACDDILELIAAEMEKPEAETNDAK